MRNRIIGVQIDRQLVLLLDGIPVPIVEVEYESQRGVSLAEMVVQGRRFVCRGLDEREGLRRRQNSVFPITR